MKNEKSIFWNYCNFVGKSHDLILKAFISIEIWSCSFFFFFFWKMILCHSRWENENTFIFSRIQTSLETLKKIFSGPNPSQFWKLKFPFYNEPLKLVARFLLFFFFFYYFIERWMLELNDDIEFLELLSL